jgi:AICAR transformylase/IMP cyclohydrolase PurH
MQRNRFGCAAASRLALVPTRAAAQGASPPIQGDVRILDAINPFADGVKRARAGGITTVNIMPGSSHLMSGQTAYVKLRDDHGR